MPNVALLSAVRDQKHVEDAREQDSTREEIAAQLLNWVKNGHARRFACAVETQSGDVLVWTPEGVFETLGLLDMAKHCALKEAPWESFATE